MEPPVHNVALSIKAPTQVIRIPSRQDAALVSPLSAPWAPGISLIPKQINNFPRLQYIERPGNDTLPQGWTFHPKPITWNSLPASTPRHSTSHSSTSLDRVVEWGYFHHAERRITTTIDIISKANILQAIVAEVQLLKTDEFTEIIACGEPDITNDKEYTLFRADHFNRTFNRGSAGPCTQEETSKKVYNEDYFKWVLLVGQSAESHLFLPSVQPKKYSCLGRKIAQQVVWDHQNGKLFTFSLSFTLIYK